MAPKKTVRFISLGCPKNLVDTEVYAGVLDRANYAIVAPDTASDVGVINTCGFIGPSKQESIASILEWVEEKKNGRLKLLIVTGCLASRYPDQLPKEFAEVDAFIGTSDYSRLPEIIAQKWNDEENNNFISPIKETLSWDLPRLSTSYSRYVKISEGCSHSCTFCTIPLMRGGLVSRPLEDIIREVQSHLDFGVSELNFIAQDLNEYGRDLHPRQSLHKLFSALATVNGKAWMRPLYMYPLQFSDKLIALMKDHPLLVPYVDIPLQHIDDLVLKSMKRGSSSRYIYRLIDKLRQEIPDIFIRTTFITGFPGETETAFNHLLRFIREMEFENVGVFTYSQEEQTPSALMADQVPEKIKTERRRILMEVQQEVSLKKNQRQIGKEMTILFEQKKGRSGQGRHAGQAPEIDGEVILRGTPEQFSKLIPGQFVTAKIIEARPYDLVGLIA